MVVLVDSREYATLRKGIEEMCGLAIISLDDNILVR